MKINKFLVYIALILPALLMQSCLKDQEDTFDKPSSARMQSYLSEAQKTLASAEYGWVFDYYPDRDLSYGGYTYTLKFNDDSVTIGSESADQEETSLYRLTTDDGPVLSFDSYNTLMHLFATPSASLYEAYDGDFEFIIDSIGADKIKVHGKRTLNTMYLYKLTKPAGDYLSKVDDTKNNMIIQGIKGTAGSKTVNGAVDLESRYIDIIYDDTAKVSTSFVYTETGIRFYEPVTIGGVELSYLDFNATDNTLTSTDDKGNTVTLQGVLPEGYVPYADFAGDYTLTYNVNPKETSNPLTVDVTLTPDKDGTGYILSGLNDNYTLKLTYNHSLGLLELNSQSVGTYNGNTVWICAWGRQEENGYLTWDTSAGMRTEWNKDKENPVYYFVWNGYSGFHADSFLLWELDSSGSSVGSMSGAKDWYTNNSYQFPYIYSLKKK